MESFNNLPIPHFNNDNEKKQWLIEHYPYEPNKFLSKVLNWDLDKISRTVRRLKIYKTPETRTKISSRANRKYYVNHKYFDVWTADSAYIMGFLTADGAIHNQNKSLIFGLKEEDKYVLEYMRSEIGSNQLISTTTKKVNGKTFYGNAIQFTHRELIDSLYLIGMSNPKNECKILDNIPKEFYWNWLHGLFDGDGSCGLYYASTRKQFLPKWSICNKSGVFLNKINSLIIKDDNVIANKSSASNVYNLYYGSKKTLQLIYDNIYTKRTPKQYLIRKKNTMDSIIAYINR